MKIGICGLLTVLLASVSQPSFGVCFVGELDRVATVTIGACVELTEFAAKRLEGSQLPWVLGYIQHLLSSQDGVVIAGTVTKKIHVTQYSDTDFAIEDIQLVDQPGKWFVRLETPGSCRQYPADSEVEVFMRDRCCDVIPPSDIPCALEVGSAREVPPPLQRLLENE